MEKFIRLSLISTNLQKHVFKVIIDCQKCLSVMWESGKAKISRRCYSHCTCMTSDDLKEELSDKFQGLPFLDNIASDITGTKWNTMSNILLLYADDTAILAEQEEMQLILDALAAYYDKNSL